MRPVSGVRVIACPRKVHIRLPGRGNSKSRGARPVFISMIKWTRTSRLSKKISLSVGVIACLDRDVDGADDARLL